MSSISNALKLDIPKLFMLLLAIFYFITFTTFMLLGESRIDVYVSLYILEYYVLYAILSPIGARAERFFGKLSYIYLAVFIIIVTYRVMEILRIKLW